MAIIVLRVGDVLQPLREEAGDVHVVAGGADKDLRVAGPSEAFVALRAISGHAQEISALTPDDVLVKAIQIGIGTFERSGWRVGGADHDGMEIVGFEFAGVAGDFGVTKPVEGKMRFQRLAAIAGKREFIGFQSCPEIFGI